VITDENKQKFVDATSKVKEYASELEKDEDVKKLLDSGKAWITQLEDKDKGDKDTDPILAAAAQGKDYIVKIRETGIGKDLLKKGAGLLSELKKKWYINT